MVWLGFHIRVRNFLGINQAQRYGLGLPRAQRDVFLPIGKNTLSGCMQIINVRSQFADRKMATRIRAYDMGTATVGGLVGDPGVRDRPIIRPQHDAAERCISLALRESRETANTRKRQQENSDQ